MEKGRKNENERKTTEQNGKYYIVSRTQGDRGVLLRNSYGDEITQYKIYESHRFCSTKYIPITLYVTRVRRAY